MITEFVHKRDVARKVKSVSNVFDWSWQYFMRFYFQDCTCIVKMANVQREYGFEYLGVGERLVQTPLTDRCYLTLT